MSATAVPVDTLLADMTFERFTFIINGLLLFMSPLRV